MARSPAKPPRRKRATSDDVAPVAVDTTVEVVAAGMQAPAAAGECTVTLESNGSIKEAAALHKTLLAVVQAQGPVLIDAGAVERVDTATLQLLYAFVRDRVAADREVAWRGVTDELSDAARLLGVRDLLCLPAVR